MNFHDSLRDTALNLPSTHTVVGADGFAGHKLLLQHAYPLPQISGVSWQNTLGAACYISRNKAWTLKTHGLGLDSLVSAAQAMSEGMGKGSVRGSCTPSREKASLAGRALAEHLLQPGSWRSIRRCTRLMVSPRNPLLCLSLKTSLAYC